MSEKVDKTRRRKTKDALVFMVVGLNTHFKLPVAYFYIDGITGVKLAELVRECLDKIHSAGKINLNFKDMAVILYCYFCVVISV